ncbi:hypothetical protein UFOVP152_20 [uncultured Caudovirales phage]|uniref:Uncharacterized protein n=1 Tax=uncultured Caudovirales phage TaxID=2100421 RepID=A0A6J7W834_9CAUD|nr:hypothetical protein UFOVP152_20 [uncultured Caudovirales phage]
MPYQKVNKTSVTAYGGANAKPQQLDYDGVTVTPADATNLPNGICRGVYVTGTGNIAATTPSGATVVLTGVPANTVVPIDLSIIASTGTTATGILALY